MIHSTQRHKLYIVNILQINFNEWHKRKTLNLFTMRRDKELKRTYIIPKLQDTKN